TAETVGVSTALAATTARAALQFATNSAAGGLVSTSAAALTQGVLRAMMWTKVKLASVAVAACLLAVGAGWYALQGAATVRGPALPQKDGKPKTDAELFRGP